MDTIEINNKNKKALEYYLSQITLKDVVRTGWNDWKLKRDRLESVADHVFGCQQLAIGIWSEFDIDVDINKVLSMLSMHETGEPVIGDIPLVHKLKKYKKEMENVAVLSMTENLRRKEYVNSLVSEFEEGKTVEARFAKIIDKLECDIMSKLYDEEGIVDIYNQEGNASAKLPIVVELLDLFQSFSKMWMEFGRRTYNYPEELNELSKYAEENNLHEIRDNHINKAKAKVAEFLDKKRKPVYQPGMLCKHFKGETLSKKNIYRIEALGIEGKDINPDYITYSGDNNLEEAKNLVLYSNIFQNFRLFAREYEDISAPLDEEKKEKFNQTYRVEPLTEKEIETINYPVFKKYKKMVYKNKNNK